jgi:hypothetical protein
MGKISFCIICNKQFDVKWHDRDKVCSEPCRRLRISQSKYKYSESQIKSVIDYKKLGMPNKQIYEITGVKLSKIKEITKENNLFLSQEIRTQNAFNAKLKKNKNAMEDMRLSYKKKATSSESLELIKNELKEKGYEYVKGFEGKSKPFYVKCLKCNNVRETSKINTVIKDTCGLCNNLGNSKQEDEIRTWIESFGIKTEKFKFKDRKDGREIDIFIPHLNIGIEYCGLYWHNEESPTPRGKDYHLKKMIKANTEGIRLITIFEDEWFKRQEQVKNFLKSVLNINTKKVYARKCVVKEVDTAAATSFLEHTHIQGKSRAEVYFGLYNNNELLGIMSGNIHHRKNNKNDLILNRLSFKDEIQVIGGASKLFKALIQYAKTNGYEYIVSWSDNRWSEGNVYGKLGFFLEEILLPDYSYVNGPSRLSKQMNTKALLLKKGAIGNMDNTETELAHSLGYKKMWDCGKKRWIYKV